jgi:hypothetical protein
MATCHAGVVPSGASCIARPGDVAWVTLRGTTGRPISSLPPEHRGGFGRGIRAALRAVDDSGWKHHHDPRRRRLVVGPSNICAWLTRPMPGSAGYACDCRFHRGVKGLSSSDCAPDVVSRRLHRPRPRR